MLRFLLCTVALNGFALEQETACPRGKQHYRASARHIEKGGIGYEDGYTTLEVFLAPDPSRSKITPFFDARGHVFDNRKWAANAGIGLRTLWGNRAYGVNAYYDYRNADHLHSNQIGAGLETLGEFWDVRINGYLPIGRTISNPYATTFGSFSGNFMLLSQKYQSAMRGADAEWGIHFGKSEFADFYLAIGPYYFIGEKTSATWGGKAKLVGLFKDILTLEISDSYDKTFHNKFQGQISLGFSFGPKSKVREEGRTCRIANILNDRMLQPVSRQEIIVIDETRKQSVAIDPVTGLPYFFVFVDNTSNSDGTYESPYHSLAQAQDNSSQRDIVYVFPGDGTTKGMNSGIILKANQKFWGSGISHLIQTSAGTVSIPAQSSGTPTITNTNVDTELNAITLSTNNAISGVTISSALNDAIYGVDPQSLEVSFCTIENTSTFTIETISSNSASISLTNNQFLNNVNGASLTFNGTSNLVCAGNVFKGQTSVSEMPLNIATTNNHLTTYIANNVFDNNRTGSVRLSLTNVANANITVLNNVMTNNRTGDAGSGLGSNFVVVPTGTTDRCSIAFTGNIFSGNTANSIYFHNQDQITNLEVTASSNTMSNNGGSAIALATSVNNLTLVATGNTITECNDNGIATVGSTPFQTANITINNNTITDIGNGQSAIAMAQASVNLNFTVENNVITGCGGSGIFGFASEFTNMTATITGNVISDCRNEQSNAASGISIDTYVNLVSTIANNTLSGNVSPGFTVGFFTSGNPSVCLTLTGNRSDTDPGYSLTNPGSGAFNLSPCNVDAVNVGTITKPDTFTSVQSCPGAVPCPP